MNAFLTPNTSGAFAGVCPGQKESAGKRLSGKWKKGNRYVREVLVQAAHGVRRCRTYLGERYRRLKKRRGSKRAALAVGHDILVIYCQMMKTGQDYQEKGVAFFQQRDRNKVERHWFVVWSTWGINLRGHCSLSSKE